MSAAQQTEWLNLVEKIGPFLAPGVLAETFPQGLERVETRSRQRIRSAYEEWREAVDAEDPVLDALHAEWVRLVLEELLGYEPTVLKSGADIPSRFVLVEPHTGCRMEPSHAVLLNDSEAKLLIKVCPPDTGLSLPIPGETWAASPIERMTQLCKATGVPVGLVTDGEQWALVSAPPDGASSHGIWFSRIWQQEPITLQAFVSLLDVRRCFGAAEGTPQALFAASLEHQNEVTDILGEQVRRAIEVLVQALDKADLDRDRELLKDVSPSELYEAGLTVMMRLVVLLCAEERGLLLLDDPTYRQSYAASTLRAQLKEEHRLWGGEILEHRHDAWARLLALFRGVFGGIEHESLRLPPLGGSLFDPDRFPFLEGRPAGSCWRDVPATPLPIDNRTVLLLLSALQVLEKNTGAIHLSYELLDVEQIGHVYEGLLERAVRRVPETTLGLLGSQKAVNPNASIRELEEAQASGQDKLLSLLLEKTGRSESALRKTLEKRPEEALQHAILAACGGDTALASRIAPWALLLRKDAWGEPVIYRESSFQVGFGTSRRETGAHYTPKILTEPIVQHTLEPLVYEGPAEGVPTADWKLKVPSEILALKVCDMAMGSAAFLVQVCRYLGERLVEAWDIAERSGKFVSIDGKVLDAPRDNELLPKDGSERQLIARRLVSSSCIYGVDFNPMAVELAKVSLWLVTMQKNKPFTFLDHALKCGDSLLGVSSFQQIENFSLRSGERQVTFATANLFRYVDEASAKRRALEDLPSNDHTQIETKNHLHAEAEADTAKVKALADCLIALELRGLDGDSYEDQRTAEAEKVQLLMKRDADASIKSQTPTINQLTAHAREQLRGQRTFHWPVEFPEVFQHSGFDAFVGNPPYMGGKKISGRLGDEYRQYVVTHVAQGIRGVADLCVFFFLRVLELMKADGCSGMVVTSSLIEGDTREVGLDRLEALKAELFRADTTRDWPGSASVTYCSLWVTKPSWRGKKYLDAQPVVGISSALTESRSSNETPFYLQTNAPLSHQGSVIHGDGFVLSPAKALGFIEKTQKNAEVLCQYLRGGDFNDSPSLSPSVWVINFHDWPQEKAAEYEELFQIVREKVKPERALVKRPVYRDRWWQYAEKQRTLYETIAPLRRILFHCFTSKFLAFGFVPSTYIYAAPHVVIALERDEHFCLLQSGIHETWVRRYTSYLSSSLRYIATDVFATFPFPSQFGTLAQVGRAYHLHRDELMQSRTEGMTTTYNRFHDRGEQSADIARLRALHVEMDQAVAAAYGWSDLDLGHGFHATKQGERYTLSEPARRTVLDRLLALNHQRYAEEVAAGLHEKKKAKSKAWKKNEAQGQLL